MVLNAAKTPGNAPAGSGGSPQAGSPGADLPRARGADLPGSPAQGPRSRPSALVWLLLSALVIGLDQWSKAWVLARLPEFEAVQVIDGIWNWYRTYNTGAAFSFLSNAGGWQIWFFTALAVIVCGLLGWWLSRTPRGDWRTALPYALVIGGALGNVIDRLLHGHVIDFIQWYVGDHYWPSFNIADSAIVCGAVGIALSGLLKRETREEE